MSSWAPAALEALIEGAAVDAYGEDEQLTGFFTMIEESLAVPFTTTVLGVDLAEDGRVVARCARGSVRQDIGIRDLPHPCSNGQSFRLPLTGPTAGNRRHVARIPQYACGYG